jgi:hypothetical protein
VAGDGAGMVAVSMDSSRLDERCSIRTAYGTDSVPVK